MPGSLSSLLWLTLGAFAIGTEGFMIAGLLPALARDLNVGLPAAGHLVTAFSLAYAIGAPVMAVLTAGLERRRLLAVAMGGFSLANLLAALAPGYAGLLVARLLLALSAASFMPAASGYAAALGGPERRGRALSMVTTGLTLAIIAGVPLGVLVGRASAGAPPSSAWRGWRRSRCSGSSPGCRASRLASPQSGRASGASQAPRYPGGPGDQRADGGRHLHALHLSGRLPRRRRRARPAGLALVLLGFGVASAVGTRLGGTAADHWGAAHTVIVGGGLTAWPILSSRWARRSGRRGPCWSCCRPSCFGAWPAGADDGAAGAAGRASSGSGAGQPLAELVGHLSRQRNGRRSRRAGHRRWRSGAARLGGGGIRCWPRCCRCRSGSAPPRHIEGNARPQRFIPPQFGIVG